MKEILKHIIKSPLKFLFSIRPKNDMSSNLYRTRLYFLGQIQKLMMKRVRKEAHKGHIIEFISPNYLSDWRAQTFSSKEPETLDWIDNMPMDSIMWDIGANIGAYSLYASKTKGSKVFAFEPSVFNLELLARNIYKNNLQHKICIVPIALSDKTNFNYLHLSLTEWGSALSTFGEEFGWDGKKINKNFQFKTIGISMDNAVDYLNIPPPDFIKMDVDGLEHIILLGGKNVLSKVQGILIEVNDNFKDQVDGVSKILSSAGLKLTHKKLSPNEFSKPSDSQSESTFNQIWNRK